MRNSLIKNNLIALFNRNFDPIKNSDISDLVDDLTLNCPKGINLDTGKLESLYSKREFGRLKKLKQNKHLAELYLNTIQQINLADNYLNGLKDDIIESFKIIKQHVLSNGIREPNQIIFIEHDYEPKANLNGFGIGDYPILDQPSCINLKNKNIIYAAIGQINYSDFWSAKIQFETEIEKLGMDDMILYSGYYGQVEQAYWFKTCLTLFDSFDNLDINQIDGASLKLPLYIYANAHDSEAINIYIYEE